MKTLSLCLVLVYLLHLSSGLPRPSKEERDEEYSPPDHVAGMPLERDGELNTKMDAELFLGKEQGTAENSDAPSDINRLLTNTFHKADKNEDGLLGFWELKDWIYSKMEEHRKEAEMDPEMAYVADFDLNHDNKMSWEEYTTKLRNHVKEVLLDTPDESRHKTDEEGRPLTLDQEVEKALEYTFQRDQRRFKYADKNNDDRVDNEEYLYFMHPEYNKESLKALAADLLKKLDENKDNVLSENEFINYYSELMEQQYATDSQKKTQMLIGRWKRTFHKVIDRNGDGTADLIEFAEFLDPTNEQHAMDEASYLLSQADSNDDDQLTLNEVLKHPDLFAGSSLTDSSYRIHWDEL